MSSNAASSFPYTKSLQTRRYIHFVAENILILCDDITDVDANTKFNALCPGNVGVPGDHTALNIQRAANRIDDAGELDQYPVASCLDYAAPVLGDLRID
jgi:hypothetical protein